MERIAGERRMAHGSSRFSAPVRRIPQMKKLLVLLLAVLALATVASAQITTFYSINYYSNRNNAGGADQVFRVTNPGTAGSPISVGHGTICADIFVFDSNQEMIECC